MDSNMVITVVGGIGSLLGLSVWYQHNKQYRKAKKLLESLKSRDAMSVEQSIQAGQNGTKDVLVYGQIESLNSDKTVYREIRPRHLSLWNRFGQPALNGRRINASEFLLVHNGARISVQPSQSSLSFGLHREDKPLDALTTILQIALACFGGCLTLSLNMGPTEYLAYDGEQVTLFGTLGYNPKTNEVLMKKLKFLASGSTKDVEDYLSDSANASWWTKTVALGLSGLVAGYIGLRWWREAKRVYNAKRKERETRQLREKMEELKIDLEGNEDMLCIVCRDNIRNVIYYPCKHLITCSLCHAQMDNARCPVCRTNVERTTEIQISG